MPAKRDPLLTAKGTKYTYVGWVRRRHQIRDNQERAAFDRAYPEFFHKMIDRDNQEADRIYERSRKPKQSKPKPSARRPVFGSPPPKPARKPTTSKPKKFTKLQRQLIAKGIRIERQLQGQNNQARERTLRSEQREVELRLLRLDRDAERELTRRLTEMRAQDYNRSMRDIKKKHAFTSGRFSSGTDYLN